MLFYWSFSREPPCFHECACPGSVGLNAEELAEKQQHTNENLKATDCFCKDCHGTYYIHGWICSYIKYGNLCNRGEKTCGSRATCGSLKDYLWLSINVPEFPFHFCVIIFKQIIVAPYVFLMWIILFYFKIREILTPISIN